jgi:ferrous-iron efflux pump FieF
MTAAQIQRRIAAASIAMSFGFMVALLAVYFRFASMLALSQAADSFVDVFASSAILYAIHVGMQPADAGHPRGHYRAEPIAALIAAVLAGVLAFEVIRSAVEALVVGARPVMHGLVAAAFGAKLLGKLGVFVAARSWGRGAGSPALRALAVDARNDVLVASVALVGFFAARYGWPGWDAWLSIPIGAWIGAAGLSLAMENVRMLMGSAAPEARWRELRAIAEAVPGVHRSKDWKVRYEGPGLEVVFTVLLDEGLSLREACALSGEVERRLTAEPDVVHVVVHLEVDTGN